MEEPNVAVEQPVEKAPEINVPEVSPEKDVAALLAAKDTEIARLADERENYRKGMLQAKGKTHDPEPEDDESLDALIARKVEEKLFDVRANQLKQEKDLILTEALKENAELRNALKSRAGGPSSAGSNQDKPEVKNDNYWSPEQEASLTSRGLDPKAVWKNMPKGPVGDPAKR